MKVTTIKLQKAITNIYNHLYANAEKKTPHGISREVGKLLHTGMFIEENGKPIAFSFDKTDEKQFLNGGSKVFADSIRASYKQMNKAWKIYDSKETIVLKDYDISYTCIQLQGIKISDPNRDVFGDSLEIFRSQWAKQIGGQFFTDSLVTRLAMKLLEFDPRKGDDLIDICSGTGGFLLAGLNHIREIIEENSPEAKNIEKQVIALARESIRGQEYDKEVCSIANATLNARLGEINEEFVIQGDSLDNNLINTNKSHIKFDGHKCVAGNPPFGTKITIKDPRILEHFELAKVKARQNELFPSKITPRAPDILFLEQNVKLLVPGSGRLSLVVPYQILSGPQTLYIRKWLLLNTEILSIIDLPAETFQPHTGTKGCLLTLRRRRKPLEELEQIKDYEIFMSTPRWIGHDRRGNPVFKRLPDGTLTEDVLTDFNELEKAYRNFKKGKKFEADHKESFIVKNSSILNTSLLQLNAQFHKPSEYRTTFAEEKEWKRVKLYDVVKDIFYPGRFSRGYVDPYPGAVPFYGGKEIIQMVTESNKWISHNHPKMEELAVKAGWILITRSGTTGIVSCVPEAWHGYAMSEHVIRIVPDENKINPYYLLAYLRTNYCQDLIAKGVYGSVIDSITPDFIGNLDILIPTKKNVLSKIIEKTKEAEEARNMALLKNAEGVGILNEMLVN
jgi:type I restriction-modification system DNA methylase subunit